MAVPCKQASFHLEFKSAAGQFNRCHLDNFNNVSGFISGNLPIEKLLSMPYTKGDLC